MDGIDGRIDFFFPGSVLGIFSSNGLAIFRQLTVVTIVIQQKLKREEHSKIKIDNMISIIVTKLYRYYLSFLSYKVQKITVYPLCHPFVYL